MNFIVLPYEPMPETFSLPLAQWENFLRSVCPIRHGVAWNLKHTYPQDAFVARHEPLDNANAATPPAAKRVRLHSKDDLIWRAEYICHRAKSKRVRADRQAGGTSGKVRPLQKASKRIGCSARLSIVYNRSEPENVLVRLHGGHNHTIGSIDDLQFLPLSPVIRELVATKLAEGYRRRDIRRSLQRQLGSATNGTDAVTRRDSMIHDGDIYNIWRRIESDFFRKKQDEKESVLAWLDGLREKQFSIFKDETFVQTMTFGFCSPQQQQLLESSDSICLDATHDVSNHTHGILYTIVVRHPVTGAGYPVAFLFTLDHSSRPLKNWLSHIKDLGLRPLKITIDCSNVEGNALSEVYPEVPVQWCAFHVGRAVWQNLNTRVTGDAASELRKAMMSHIKGIMWNKDPAETRSQLLAFKSIYSGQLAFQAYFDKQWVNEGRFEKWTASNQPNFETDMETNNFVESWHNQLKTFYLERRHNRRVDRLIYILVHDVQFDMDHNVERATHNIGRMSAGERAARIREVAAETIPDAILGDMVEMNPEQSSVMVASFSDPDEHYTISLQGETMMRCECPDYTYRRTPCKHMYVAKRAKPQLQISGNQGEF